MKSQKTKGVKEEKTYHLSPELVRIKGSTLSNVRGLVVQIILVCGSWKL